MAYRVISAGVIVSDGFKTVDAAQRWAETQFVPGAFLVERSPGSCC